MRRVGLKDIRHLKVWQIYVNQLSTVLSQFNETRIQKNILVVKQVMEASGLLKQLQNLAFITSFQTYIYMVTQKAYQSNSRVLQLKS